MQVDDCDRSPLAAPPIPESGRFVNRRRPLGEQVHRLWLRMPWVAPTPKSEAQRGGKSISTTSAFSR